MRLDPKAVYVLANAIFPDDADLATFNLIVELHNGHLACDDPDAPTDGEGVLLAGYYAFIDIGGGQTFHTCRTFPVGTEPAEILERLGEAIAGLPEEPPESLATTAHLAQFPSANAVMAAWRFPDGGIRTFAYRHPDLPHARAATTLKGVFARLDAEREKRKGPQGPKN